MLALLFLLYYLHSAYNCHFSSSRNISCMTLHPLKMMCVYEELEQFFYKECCCDCHVTCAKSFTLCVVKLNFCPKRIHFSHPCGKCYTKFKNNEDKFSIAFLKKLLRHSTVYAYPDKVITYFAHLMRTNLVGKSIEPTPPNPGGIPLWERDALVNTLVGCFTLFGYDTSDAWHIATIILETNEATDPTKQESQQESQQVPHNENRNPIWRPIMPMPVSCRSFLATPVPAPYSSPIAW